MSKRAAIYVRYSSKKQSRDSLEHQTWQCTEYAKKNDMEVVHVYSDAEQSGKSTRGRDAFRQMINDSTGRDRPYDVVIIFHVDRLARRVADATHAHDQLCHAGVELHTSSHGKLNGIVLAVLAALAQAQSEATAMHTQKSLAGHTRKGRSGGGLGYLLSQLVRCAHCGGNYTVIGDQRYGCATRKMKGLCDNSRTISRRVLDGRTRSLR